MRKSFRDFAPEVCLRCMFANAISLAALLEAEAVFVPEIDERRTVKLPRRRYIEEIISPAQPSHARYAYGEKDISSGGHGIHGNGQRYCEKHKEHGMRTPSDGLEHARVKTLKVQHGLFCIYCCVHYISQCLILLLKAWG